MSCAKRLISWGTAVFMLLVLSLPAQAVERVTYYHTNALGSPVAATDASGELLWREAYTPFGERLLKEASTGEEVWYTGKQEESTYGVSYFGARWYDPEIGRFLAIDPVGVDVGNLHSFNRYVYVNNNPYKFIDPDGRIATWLNGHKIGMPLDTAVQAGAVGNGIAGAAATPYIIASSFVVGPESLGGGVAAATVRFVPRKAVTGLVTKSADNVWDSVKATQGLIKGTSIPKSFELSVDAGKFWVHPHATKHMAEYLTRNGLSHGSSMSSKAMMKSFQSAVNQATANGYKAGEMIHAGRWEIMFGSGKAGDALPVIKHALYK